MMHPALKNYWCAAIYLGICVLLGLSQAAALSPLINLPAGWLIADGLLFGVLFGVLGIPLWMVVQFVDFSKASIYQQLLNSIALCVLTISCWLGLGLFLLYIIFPADYFVMLLPTIPMRVISGVLFYYIAIQRYNAMIYNNKAHDEIEQEPFDVKEEIQSEENLESNIELIDRIAVKLGSKIHVINVPDILYLQAEGDYVMIHSHEGKYLKEQTMKYFEMHLPQNKFVRVHRSCIVNVEIVSRVELYEKQNYMLILQNGEKIKTSASGYKQLKRVLNL